MKDKPKVVEVKLTFEDGGALLINCYELRKLETAREAIDLLERARNMYEYLASFLEK